MKIEFKFRHVPQSEELTAYIVERISKLNKFEMKPVRFEFTFSSEKTAQRVDIHVRGQDIEMHAHASGDNFFSASDDALDRIARQLSRKKAKVQDHKGPTIKVS